MGHVLGTGEGRRPRAERPTEPFPHRRCVSSPAWLDVRLQQVAAKADIKPFCCTVPATVRSKEDLPSLEDED